MDVIPPLNHKTIVEFVNVRSPHGSPSAAQCRSTVLINLENIFDDFGVSGQLVDEMMALERDTFQRCLSAQPAPANLPLQLTSRTTVRSLVSNFGIGLTRWG